MQTSLTKWGNSLAIRLPKAFTKQIGVSDGDQVSLDLKNNRIVISSSDMDLSNLMSEVTANNIHSETFVDNPIGNEIW